MPVLMNKGNDPRRAAWLFYSDRATLDGFLTAATEGRFESGVLRVDEGELASAKKASTELTVYLDVETVVPDDVDLEEARGKILEHAKNLAETMSLEGDGADTQVVPDTGVGADASAGDSDDADADPTDADPTDADADPTDADPTDANPAEDDAEADANESAGADADEGTDADEDAPLFDYEPVPAPQGTRVVIGRTTRQAATNYIVRAEGDEGDEGERPDLPGLQMLCQLIELMRDSGNGIPALVVWRVDDTGILRMAPAKQVKPMAGNILRVKL